MCSLIDPQVSLSLEEINLATLAGQHAPGLLLSQHPQGWDYRHLLLCLAEAAEHNCVWKGFLTELPPRSPQLDSCLPGICKTLG